MHPISRNFWVELRAVDVLSPPKNLDVAARSSRQKFSSLWNGSNCIRMTGVGVEFRRKLTGEGVGKSDLGQGNFGGLEIFRETLNDGRSRGSSQGLQAKTDAESREIALQKDGGQGVNAFFNAQVFGSFLLMRVLETERRAGDDDTRILV